MILFVWCAVAVVVAAVIGILTTRNADFAMYAAIAVLGLGLMIAEPMILVSLAVPATLILVRVGGVLSVSDVVLALATVTAVLIVRPKGLITMQPLIWAGVAYLAASVPTVVLNVYSANAVEWGHEFVLVLGSMVVGFSIARRGFTRFAVGAYVLACFGIAVVASLTALMTFATQHVLEPVYLPELHKNTIGGMLGVAAVVIYGRPTWFRLPSAASWTTMIVLACGIVASQSRQSMIGLLVGLLAVSVRRREETGKFPKLVWFASVPVLVYVTTMLNDQLTSDNQFNSAHQRLDWYAQTFDIWHTSPFFGVGLRWWYTNRFDAWFQPPNAELEVLSSVGVVGLVGFLAMFAVAVWFLWRLDPAYGTVGAAVVLTRFTQAQFDLYWVAGQASLLWIVAGICYGALERDRALGQLETRPSVDFHRPRLIVAPSRMAPFPSVLHAHKGGQDARRTRRLF